MKAVQAGWSIKGHIGWGHQCRADPFLLLQDIPLNFTSPCMLRLKSYRHPSVWYCEHFRQSKLIPSINPPKRTSYPFLWIITKLKVVRTHVLLMINVNKYMSLSLWYTCHKPSRFYIGVIWKLSDKLMNLVTLIGRGVSWLDLKKVGSGFTS